MKLESKWVVEESESRTIMEVRYNFSGKFLGWRYGTKTTDYILVQLLTPIIKSLAIPDTTRRI